MTEQILELYRLLLRSDEESFSEVFSNVCARDILAMEHQVQDAIDFIMGIGINEKKRAPYMVDRLKDLYKEIGDFIEAISFFRAGRRNYRNTCVQCTGKKRSRSCQHQYGR